MKTIKKKDLLKRIENLEEAVSTLMMERFINHLNDIEVEVELKPKKDKEIKEEVNQEPKKRGRKPKKEVE